MESIPAHLLARSLLNIVENRIGEGRWARAADDLVKVQLHLRDGHTLLDGHASQPDDDILDELHHDGQFGFTHEGPLAEGLAFGAQYRVLVELGLIDFNAHHHVDVGLLPSWGNEVADGSQCLNVDVCVHTALDVHDHVAQQVGLDDARGELTVHVHDILPIEAIWSKVCLDVGHVIQIGEHLISVIGVLCNPRLRNIVISLLELEGVNFPGLPDLARKVLGSRFEKGWGKGAVRAGQEEDQEAQGQHGRYRSLQLLRHANLGYRLQIFFGTVFGRNLHLTVDGGFWLFCWSAARRPRSRACLAKHGQLRQLQWHAHECPEVE